MSSKNRYYKKEQEKVQVAKLEGMFEFFEQTNDLF